MNGDTSIPHFHKYQALGNDYLVIDPSEFPLDPAPDRVRAICDRNRGAGSDGILLGPLTDPGGSAAPFVRIFNPDGSEAEKSGNGVRIFARYLIDKGFAGNAAFPLLTKGGPVSARLVDAEAGLFEIDMGAASFSAASHGLFWEGGQFVNEPLSVGGETFTATFVSMGNPHCVIIVRCATREIAERYGPLVERHPMFPERTNVQFMEILDRDSVKIEIWERGAGYTLASGSSSCAAASAARRLGLVDDEVRVFMPGGFLDIEMSDDRVLMTGPVRNVFEGRFSPDFLRGIGMEGV